jgi:hypothetical protein
MGDFEERYWSPLNCPVLDDAGDVRWIIHRSKTSRSLSGKQAEGEQDRLPANSSS